MQTITFLTSVLSTEGHYCTVSINLRTEETVQEFHTSLEEALRCAEEASLNGLNAYFALATFENSKSRKVANVKHLKSVYIDIDCGLDKFNEGKGYKDQSTGVLALRDFCKQTGLPRPTIVNSGRGVHAYWPLTEAVSCEQWVEVTTKLKALCKQQGLLADPKITGNAAGILRVPDTYNYKDDPPKLVHVMGELGVPISLEDFDAKLGDVDVPVARAFTPGSTDGVTSALAGSYKNSFKTILIKTAEGKGCQQIAHIVKNRATIGYDLWLAGLSVAKFCEDAEKAIHKISQGHPNYDPDITMRRAASIKGPHRCVTFEEINPGGCDDCQFKGKFGSPIVLGREVQEASEEDNIVQDRPEVAQDIPLQTYVIPQLPTPYFRGKGGGVFKRAKDKQGDPIDVPVYHNDLYVTRRLNDQDAGEAIVMRLHLPKDGVREFTVPLVNLLSKDEFRKSVAPKGVAVLDMGELMVYTNTWVNRLQASAAADIAHRQFGWSDDRHLSFIVGEKEILADRVEINPPSKATAGLFPAFRSKGTMDGWRTIANFYNRPNMELHQYVIGLSFGSPLMAFTTANASLFHIHSKDSGLGKTTAMKAGASIWGNPDLIMMREGDTANTKMNRCEVLKNIFAPMDELTNMLPKDASDLVYMLTGGMQKNRMSAKSNEERVRGAPWRTNVVSTGNTSLLERMSLYKSIPKAEAMRVLEYKAEAYRFDTKTETDDLSLALESHYGHACVPYMQYVIANAEECRAMLYETQKRIDAAAGLAAPHRFWSWQAASAITGLLIAKKLGLVHYKISAVVAWIVDVLIEAKGSSETMGGSTEDLLTTYLAENYNNVLRIRSTDDARTGEDLDVFVVPDGTPRFTYVARYEYDIKKMYLMPKPLKEWCVKNQHNYQAFIQGLKEGKTYAVSKKIRMGKGTRMNLPPTTVWVLNFSEFDDETKETEVATGTAD